LRARSEKMQKVTVNGKEYSVEAMDMTKLANLSNHLMANGFDGVCYRLTGKRGAEKMGYKRFASGKMVIAY
jgi:hypothetical protein